MPLPTLEQWEPTRRSLHQAAQVIGAVRATVAEPEPNWVHLGLEVLPHGLTTGPLPVGELVLDFTSAQVVVRDTEGTAQSIPLSGQTQLSLADRLEAILTARGHSEVLKRDKLHGQGPLDIDLVQGRDFAQVLHTFDAALARLRHTLPGECTRLIVWPHGFDLSFLWFATEVASEEAPHMAFGFSPGSPGLERPYLYSYAYPIPEGLTTQPLPAGAHWHTTGWTGVILPFDDLARQEDPAGVALEKLRAIFETIAPLLTT